VVVPANYNCPGQLVISGTISGVDKACELLTTAGAKRALKLNVGGAFHSPLMESARVELEHAIVNTVINQPVCPIYQNIDAKSYTDSGQIKHNLIAQLTGPVRWTQTVMHMIEDGATSFTEVGPGNVLQGLVKKADRAMPTSSASLQQ
jgi:[acyl-carrier-protein] S-malonyltransferase